MRTHALSLLTIACLADTGCVFKSSRSQLTSTIYRDNDRDAFFLFFTDDAVLPRPLLGTATVAGGVGEAAMGLVCAPLDRGSMLWAGVKGLVFSGLEPAR